MTWIRTIDEVEATGELAEAYARIRQQNGAVANISKAASLKPRVAMALADLLVALRGPDCVLGRLRQEMIAVLTSALHRCAY
jgi:uncharacterized protein YfaQ (DUF2300 family)